MTARRDVAGLIIATGIGGGAGYVVTIVAAARLGADRYEDFAVFWSTLYLLIGALSGLQQEVTRATRVAPIGVTSEGSRRLVRFALLGSLTVAGVVLLASAGAHAQLFPGAGPILSIPLAVGVGAYVWVAAISGALSGMSIWRAVSSLIVIDGVLRLTLALTVLVLFPEPLALAIVVVVPFIVAPVLAWIVSQRARERHPVLDVGVMALTRNVARTLVGAAALGLLVSGMPLLLGLTLRDAGAQLAAIMFLINLARAPLVIVMLSLQSYLVVYFRNHGTGAPVVRVSIMAVAVAAVLTVSAALVGPSVLPLFGRDFVVETPILALVVSSGGAIGLLCISGAAAIATSRHRWYSAGWIVAAVVTVLLLLTAVPWEWRLGLALWVGPLIGLAVHWSGLARRSPRPLPHHD